MSRAKLTLWSSIVWAEAPRSLTSHKLRTALSTLGIGVGVAAVIWVVTLGNAGTERAKNELHQLGDGLVWVEAGSRNVNGVRLGTRQTTTLTPEDADALRRDVPMLIRVTENVDGKVLVVAEQANWTTGYRGVGPDYLAIKNWKMARGSFLTSDHVAHSDSVVILGETARKKLFGAVDPVGRWIRIGSIPFEVIGVFGPKGQSASGQDLDDTVVMPWTTAQKKLRGRYFTWLDDILCSASSPEAVDVAVGEVQALLRQRHHISADGEDDFNIRRPDELIKVEIQASESLARLLMILASISLVVGGIGITNVMLASVTARTREIGVRVAVGATASAIQVQFLGEAILLCLAGSVLGITLALAGGSLIASFVGWTAVPSPASVGVSVGIATGVGLGAAFYPAWLASRLDPVVALGSEH
jgi:putative ABC transport system permease protein